MKTANPKSKAKWKDEYAIEAYELAAQGLTNLVIARILGVKGTVFARWKRTYPLLATALRKGREKRDKVINESPIGDMVNYLTPELKEIWDKLNVLETHPSGIERINALFERNGVKARQLIFIHALAQGAYMNPTEACRKVGIARNTVDTWIQNDPEFREILEGLKTIWRERLHNRLMDKVLEGDTHAILWVNERQNKDPGLLHSGYGNKVEVNVKGSISHDHQHQHTYSLTDLDLPLDVLRTINEKIKEREQLEKQTVPAITHKRVS